MFKRLSIIVAILAFLSSSVFAQSSYDTESSTPKKKVVHSKAKKGSKATHVASAKKKGKKAKTQKAA